MGSDMDRLVAIGYVFGLMDANPRDDITFQDSEDFPKFYVEKYDGLWADLPEAWKAFKKQAEKES